MACLAGISLDRSHGVLEQGDIVACLHPRMRRDRRFPLERPLLVEFFRGRDVDDRIAYAFRLATARRPSAAEMGVLRALLAKRLAAFRRDRKAARDLVAVGEWKSDPRLDVSELAAWSMVSSTILNLDETITKE